MGGRFKKCLFIFILRVWEVKIEVICLRDKWYNFKMLYLDVVNYWVIDRKSDKIIFDWTVIMIRVIIYWVFYMC